MRTREELKEHFQAELTQYQFTDSDFDLLFAQLKNKKNFDSFFKSAALLFKYSFSKAEIFQMCKYSFLAKLEYIANNLQKIKNTKLSNEDIAEIGMKKNAIQVFKAFCVYSDELTKRTYAFTREQLVRILLSTAGIEKLEIIFDEFSTFEGKSLKQEAITDCLVALKYQEDVKVFFKQYSQIAQFELSVKELLILLQTTRLKKFLSNKEDNASYNGVKVVADSTTKKRNHTFIMLKNNSKQYKKQCPPRKYNRSADISPFAKYNQIHLEECEKLLKKLISRLPQPIGPEKLFRLALPIKEGMILDKFDYVFRYKLGVFNIKYVEHKYFEISLYPKFARWWLENFESFCLKQQEKLTNTTSSTLAYPPSASLLETPLAPISVQPPPESSHENPPEINWTYLLSEAPGISAEEQAWLDSLLNTNDPSLQDNVNTTSISSSFGMSSNFFQPQSPFNSREQDNQFNAGKEVSNENNQFKKMNQ